MKITKSILNIIEGKIKNFQYEANKSIKKAFIEQKEKCKEIKTIESTLKQIKDSIKTLPVQIINNNYHLKSLADTNNSCGNSLVEIMFKEELNTKLFKTNCNDLEFELSLIADSSDTILEIIEKVEKKYNVKI